MPRKSKVKLEDALEYGKAGRSLEEIARKFGVTRQCIKQLFDRNGVNPESVGIKIRVKKSQYHQSLEYWAKWGDRDQALYDEKRRKFNLKRSNAKLKNIEFSIQFSEIEWPIHCPVLGVELDYFAENGRTDRSVSFDRIDSNKGYISGNVIGVSHRANRIKNNGSWEEHQKIADFYKNLLT